MTADRKEIFARSVIKLFKEMVSRFLRLNISQKMRLGFLPLLVFLVLFSTFALTKLNQLTSLNESVLMVDIPIQETIRQMRTMIIDQESILRRYVILKDNAFLKVFNNNSLEFSEKINSLTPLSKGFNFPLTDLEPTYREYAGALLAVINPQANRPEQISDLEKTIRIKQTDLLDSLADIATIAKADQNQKVGISASIGGIAFKFALALCVIGIILSAAGAAFITNNIVTAVKKLQHATEEISQGKFDHLPHINNKDELGDLAQAFVEMGKRLKNLEEMYLDASPLTRLPGGVAIENMLKKRIAADRLFAFCLLDIDNFKSFNDHYGYSQGNKMIQGTAALIEEIIARDGSPDDFIGHIGGDDFVIITTPDKHRNICQGIIAKFDERTPTFYSDHDRQRGYIISENRQGQKVTYPLASISIAVVTNQDRAVKNPIEVGEIAAEIKKYSKSIAGSSLVTDHRQGPNTRTETEGKMINFPGRQ